MPRFSVRKAAKQKDRYETKAQVRMRRVPFSIRVSRPALYIVEDHSPRIFTFL
uniref:Uncharacterized protein n=1 Tax=Faecalibaculum rodentium TaxID=1702221 RepID=A0A140DRC0_9FIRM|nr:hypothetical protein AALO17_00630 [Faecalibaculum rodentium]